MEGEPFKTLSLLCRVRKQLCALPIEHAVETMRPLPIESIEGLPAFVCGLSVVRGVAVPVVDVGALLGLSDPPHPARFVTVRTGAKQVALAVEDVADIRDLPLASLPSLPPLLSKAAAGAAAIVGTLDANLLFVLETMRLIPEPVWRAIETKGGQS